MTNARKRFLLDLLERTVWTLLQALTGFLIVESADWDPAYAVPIAAGLAVLKGVLATKVGAPNTAAMLPADGDTPEPDDAGVAPLDVLVQVLVVLILIGVVVFVFTSLV